ncbi:MAG: DNA-directed RNA polymerase subunit P [Candidatus Woesearchaeota archaeon]
MVKYKCFQCNALVKSEYVKKKIRCPYCGSKIIYKPRTTNTKIKAV